LGWVGELMRNSKYNFRILKASLERARRRKRVV
jgi:hypothetical protein